jgi:hypothetical protein
MKKDTEKRAREIDDSGVGKEETTGSGARPACTFQNA